MKLAEQLRLAIGSVQSTFAQVPDQPCSLFCPKGHSKPSASQFDCFNISKSVWCTQCKGCHASTAWKCPCGLPWHTCSIHFSSPMLSNRSTTVTTARGIKRPAPVPREVSATSLRRLEPDTPSKVCLGPRLAAKFPHLVNANLPQARTYTAPRTGPGTSSSSDSPRAQQ